MKILIIEDQEKLALMLKKLFSQNGFQVEYATDAEEGQEQAKLRHKEYDLVILDLMMPKKNGLEICKNIRESGVYTPILILTAKDDINDKVSLLSSGADDYLVKPFALEELLYRIKKITTPEKVKILPKTAEEIFVLSPETRTVSYKEKKLNFTEKEFAVFKHFIQNQNRVIETKEIAEDNWGLDYSSLKTIIDANIHRTNKEMNDNGLNPGIEKIGEKGYRLNLKNL